MGTWSTKIYGNDMSEDTKDYYITHLKLKEEDDQVVAGLLESFKEILENEDYADDAAEVYFALANVQWDYGRLTEEVKEKALEYLKRDEHLEKWREEGEKELKKRLKELEKLKNKLLSEQPPRKKVVPYSIFKDEWEVGDAFAYKLVGDKSIELGYDNQYIVLRKVKSQEEWPPGTVMPMVQVYKKIFKEIPSIPDLDKVFLIPYINLDIVKENLSNEPLPYEMKLLFNKRSLKQANLIYIGHFDKIINPKNQQNEHHRNWGVFWKSFEDMVLQFYEIWKDIDFENL